MIKKLSSKTNKEILKKLIDIHRECILECNSVCYTPEKIEEWLSSINVKNIKFKLIKTELDMVEMVKKL